MTADGAGRQGEDAGTLHCQADPQQTQSVQRPVVFVLPGIGGEKDPRLERFWAPSRSMFDLVLVTYLDWTDLIETGRDFSHLATHVRRQIEARMPAGPLRIVGYSLGGHLTYATALGFQAEGRMVESVAILDAPVNLGASRPPLRKRLRARFDAFLTFNLRAGMASFLAKLLIMQHARPLLHRLSRFRNTLLPFHLERDVHHKITMQLVRSLHSSWWQKILSEAEPLETPTFLLRSEEHEDFDREDLGWKEYCLDLRVIQVTGSHHGMLDPANNAALRSALVAAMASSTE